MNKNTGIPYEKLAQHVFDQILNQKSVENINVQHNVELIGISGVVHQIDVYWEFQAGGITYKTIVQAKDWTSVVPQGELLKFKAVIDDLPGQPRGIFITRTGYQSGASNYAKAHGISIYEMREPKDQDWDGKIQHIVINLHMYVPKISPISTSVDLEWIDNERKILGIETSEKFDIKLAAPPEFILLYDEDNNVIGNLKEPAKALLPEGMEECSASLKTYTFDSPTFIKTGIDRFPRIKLNRIEATVSQHKLTSEIKINAADVVGLILKDMLNGQEIAFDKQLSIRGKND